MEKRTVGGNGTIALLKNLRCHMKDAGCGPYKLAVWDQTNGMVVMERFDDYWQGPAKTKTIIFKAVVEYSTRKALLEAGDADVILVDPIYRYDFDNNPDIQVISGHPRAQVTSIHMGWRVKETSEYIGSGKLDGKGIPPTSSPISTPARGFCTPSTTTPSSTIWSMD